MNENKLLRRRFLGMAGAAGGSIAICQTAMAMGLMQATGPVAVLDLQQPDGRHYMIDDQISYHSSWQEGAFASAEVALLDLGQRVRAASSIRTKS